MLSLQHWCSWVRLGVSQEKPWAAALWQLYHCLCLWGGIKSPHTRHGLTWPTRALKKWLNVLLMQNVSLPVRSSTACKWWFTVKLKSLCILSSLVPVQRKQLHWWISPRISELWFKSEQLHWSVGTLHIYISCGASPIYREIAGLQTRKCVLNGWTRTKPQNVEDTESLNQKTISPYGSHTFCQLISINL